MKKKKFVRVVCENHVHHFGHNHFFPIMQWIYFDSAQFSITDTLLRWFAEKNSIKNNEIDWKLKIYPGACIRPMFMQFEVTRKRKSKSWRKYECPMLWRRCQRIQYGSPDLIGVPTVGTCCAVVGLVGVCKRLCIHLCVWWIFGVNADTCNFMANDRFFSHFDWST